MSFLSLPTVYCQMNFQFVLFYFGRIPFPLKPKHPLNYTIEITRFSPSGTKRLFFGSGRQKRVIDQPFSPIIIYPFSFYRFTHMQTRKLLTQSRKLPTFPAFYALLQKGFRNCPASFSSKSPIFALIWNKGTRHEVFLPSSLLSFVLYWFSSHALASNQPCASITFISCLVARNAS